MILSVDYKYHIRHGVALIVFLGILVPLVGCGLFDTRENQKTARELAEEGMEAYKACAVVEVRPETISAKSDLAQKKNPEEREALARYLEKRGRPGDRETSAAMGFGSNDQ